MHKRKVLRFFILLILFGLGLFLIQKTYFKGTGEVISDSMNAQNAPFGVYIQSADFKNLQATAHVIVYSSESRNLDLYSYLSVNGSTLAYRHDSLSAGANTPYSITLDLPYDISQGTLILHVSDGINDAKTVQDIASKGISARVVSDSANSSVGIGTALLLGCVVLLLIIVFGVILNRHRKETRKTAIENSKQRFIKIDVR